MQLNHWSCIFYCTAAIYCWNHGIITLSMVWCTWLNPKNQSCVPRGITLFLGAACIGLIERQRNTPTAHTHTRCDKLYICNVQINIIISFAVPTIHNYSYCVCWVLLIKIRFVSLLHEYGVSPLGHTDLLHNFMYCSYHYVFWAECFSQYRCQYMETEGMYM